MSGVTINCQNLPCPQPVIRVKQQLEMSSPDSLSVIVDNEPALENVSRFLSARGYGVSCTRENGLMRVCAALDQSVHSGEAAPQPIKQQTTDQETAKILVMIISPVFGSGDDILGEKLMKNFLSTLPEMGDSLWRIVLLNGGVTLAAEGSPVLAELQALDAQGVSILACGACLDHFGLLAKKAVGQTTNMLDVVTGIQLADKIIRI